MSRYYEQPDISPASWGRTYTVADMGVIASLSADVREVVERYARHGGHRVERSDDAEDNYREGFEDGVREAADAAENVMYMDTRRRRKHA
jgi:hypothetical protein